MAEFSDKQAAAYFHRSFAAIEGLWFMKIEEKYGFDVALEIDNAVWQVFPRIQAREMKSMLKAESGRKALQICLATAFDLKGFKYTLKATETGFTVTIGIVPGIIRW